MRVKRIRKRSGGYRRIVMPTRKEKAELRDDVTTLNYAQIAYCDMDVVHGFIPGRNPVTAAEKHIGFQYTLNVDLKDFFESVKKEMLTGLKIDIKDRFFYKGVTAQGLPTSPALANLAAVPLDKELIERIKGLGIVYTRYADDLSFSGNDKDELLKLRDELASIISKHGFAINPKKTRFLSAGKCGTWTREIVGVGVDNEKVRPLRYSKRKLRGLKHRCKFTEEQLIHNKAHGMAEWVSLKKPNHEPDMEEAEAYFLMKEMGAAI